MENFNLQVKPVEPTLIALIAKFPSKSEIALIHDAEEKVRVALYMWVNEDKDIATSLLVDACLDLYSLAGELLR